MSAREPGAARPAAPEPGRHERLAGKVAIVTGAGQTPGGEIGNGRATAIAFAREGARVALLDRDRAAAEGTASEIAEAGGTASVIVGDVSVEGDCVAAVATCVAEHGGLDIVHHNVGIAGGDGWAEGIDFDAWERIMRVNAGGALLVAKAALPVLREQSRGAITYVSSIAALVAGAAPMSNPPHAYKMSKAALNALTLSLAGAYAPHGVRVNAILPGLIDTPMGVDAVARALEIPRERYAARRDEAVPLAGGMGSAWDVANAAVFLASDEARFITGVLLAVDGGQSIRVG
ncbi:MAG TPA: SDR family NAD(P)-dependent oxidoreductase [Solirubrobacteraceae bacterium]|nr:SDR family NAD(P)-dependent oxidoreductase [Solirubrobacteraceae bacterium]